LLEQRRELGAQRCDARCFLTASGGGPLSPRRRRASPAGRCSIRH